jgi:hypothetical protein
MSSLGSIVEGFRGNLDGVAKLINFDRDVLDLTVQQITVFHKRLKAQGIDNPDLNGEKTLQIVSGIRKHDSLRPRFATIFNQAVVLLVSYFASALGDIFRYGVAIRLERGTAGKLLEEEIKLTFGELRDRDWTLKEAAPDLLIAKKDLSFQDMGATHRAFDQYLGVSGTQDRRVNNIIMAQACRHVIVHAGAMVSERLVRQVAKAVPRDLKPDVRAGDRIQFEPIEVELALREMQHYVEDLVVKVDRALQADC